MDCLYASAYDNSQTGDSTDWTICARLVGDTRKSMTEEELKEREREHQKDLECFLQALFVESCKTKM